MDSAYQACLDRVGHANMHIGSLKRAFCRYIAGDAYKVEPEIHLNLPGQPEWSIYATCLKEPPAKLGLLVSDTVNDLCSALDNLVWALTVKNSGQPPDPMPRADRRKWRSATFPSALTTQNWKSVRSNNLWGIDPRLLADFEALQPYRRRQPDTELDEFAMLHALWNRDKHRHPSLVLVPTGLTGLTRTDPASGEPQDLGFEIIEQRLARPLEGRTEIARVRQVARHGWRIFGFEMDVDYCVSFGIAFEEGPPCDGQGVYTTLEACRDQVEVALHQFAPAFP